MVHFVIVHTVNAPCLFMLAYLSNKEILTNSYCSLSNVSSARKNAHAKWFISHKHPFWQMLFWKCTRPKALRWDAFDCQVILYPRVLVCWWFSCLFEMLLCPFSKMHCVWSGCLVSRGCLFPVGWSEHHCWILWSWDVFLKWYMSCLSYGVFFKEPIRLRLKIHYLVALLKRLGDVCPWL